MSKLKILSIYRMGFNRFAVIHNMYNLERQSRMTLFRQRLWVIEIGTYWKKVGCAPRLKHITLYTKLVIVAPPISLSIM